MDPNAQQPVPIQPAAQPAPATPPSTKATAAPVMPAETPISTQPVAPVQPSTPAVATPDVPAGNKSSKLGLLLGVLAAVVVVIGGIMLYQFYQNKSASSLYQNAYKTQSKVTVMPSPMPSPTIGAVKTGDAQIDQQSNSIDSSMNSLNADIKNVDTGLSDQQGNLN